jgi:ribosomal protein S12 methylthiotransferase accessory factor
MVGVGCAFAPSADDPITAGAWKAAAEAVQSLDTTVQLARGDLPEWERPHGPLVPCRPDRFYAAAYRPDFADVTDVTCHLQLLADPSFSARVLARFSTHTAPYGRVGTPGAFDVEAALAAHGLLPITVDLTTPDVAACGLSVVRVIVPGLRATTPAAFPFLGDGADPLPSAPDLLPVPHA